MTVSFIGRQHSLLACPHGLHRKLSLLLSPGKWRTLCLNEAEMVAFCSLYFVCLPSVSVMQCHPHVTVLLLYAVMLTGV